MIFLCQKKEEFSVSECLGFSPAKKIFSSSRFVRITNRLDFSSSLLLHRARFLRIHASTSRSTKNAKFLARAHASHLARSLFHVRCVVRPSRGIENATNPRHTKLPPFFSWEPRRPALVYVGGEERAFAKNLLLSRSLSRGWRDAPRVGKKNHTNRSEGMRFTKPSRSMRVYRFARAFGASFFLNHRAARERERENHSSAPEFCNTKEKKG